MVFFARLYFRSSLQLIQQPKYATIFRSFCSAAAPALTQEGDRMVDAWHLELKDQIKAFKEKGLRLECKIDSLIEMFEAFQNQNAHRSMSSGGMVDARHLELKDQIKAFEETTLRMESKIDSLIKMFEAFQKQNAHKSMSNSAGIETELFKFARAKEENPAIECAESATIYVNRISVAATDEDLRKIFEKFGSIHSAILVKHPDGKSKGFGFVKFTTPSEAAAAITQMNGAVMDDGKVLYVAKSQKKSKNRVQLQQKRLAAGAMELLDILPGDKNPSPNSRVKRRENANVFIKNLDASVDQKALNDMFAAFGTILSCKLVLDRNKQSKGYGYVQFEEEKAAQSAIKQLNGKLINDKQISVELFVSKGEREKSNGLEISDSVFVSNFSETTTGDDLKKIFEKSGGITGMSVMKDTDGKSKCIAGDADEQMDGAAVDSDKFPHVAKAKSKTKLEQERVSSLYVENLAESINEEKLKETFSECGTIQSSKTKKYMLNPSQISMRIQH